MAAPPAGTRPVAAGVEGSLPFHAACLLLCLATGIALAMAWGADIMWDLRNYHLFNAFSFVHGRLDTDISPVGLHSYFNPYLDLPFYWLLTGFGPIAAHVFLGACYGVLIWIVFLLNRRVFAETAWGRPFPPAVRCLLLPLCATVAGVTGAAALGQAATTTNEVQVAALALAGLLLVLPRAGGTAPRTAAVLGGGLLMGIAVGLKLTAAVYALGGAALLLPWRLRADEARRFVVFGAAGVAGTALAYGAWGWTLFVKFGNPLFPFYNGIFKSPWTTPDNFFDGRFLPRTLAEDLFYPAWWAFEQTTRPSELFVRDPRLLLLITLAVAFAVLHVAVRPLGRVFRMILIFGVVAYVAWLVQFSILRYAIPVEAVAGTAIVMAVVVIVRLLRMGPATASAGAIAAVFAVVAWSHVPDWGRIPFDDAYTVSMETVPDGSLVLLVGQPIAYVAALMPGRDLRFAGPVSWFGQGLLRDAMRAALDADEGRAWTVIRREEASQALLADLGWRTVEARCTPVTTAIDPTGLALCPLERLPPQG